MDKQKYPKVLHVNYSMSGGAGRAANTIAKLLENKFDIKSEVVTKTTISLRQDPLADLKTSIRSAVDNSVIKNKNFLGMYSYYRNTTDKKILEKINEFTGILHFHWINGIIKLDDIDLLASKNKKIIWTIHDLNLITGGCHTNVGCQKYIKSCNNCPAVKKMYKNLPIRQSININDFWNKNKKIRVIFPSRKLQEIYLATDSFKNINSSVIPNPLRDKFYSSEPELGDKKRNKKIRIGFISEDINDPNKNFYVILQFISRIKTENPFLDIELITVGSNYKTIPKNLKYSLTQLGRIEDDALLVKILTNFDILVSPSTFESFGLTVAEASWLGIPSLVFESNAAAYYLAKVDQRLVARDEAAYFENLKGLILNKNLRLELGGKCQKMVKYLFAPSKIAEDYAKTYLGF